MIAKGCYFCGNQSTSRFCSMCDKWLCDDCRKNYGLRTVEVFKLGIGKVRSTLLAKWRDNK